MGVGRVIATVILVVGLLLIVTGRFLGSMATLSGGTSKRAYSREVRRQGTAVREQDDVDLADAFQAIIALEARLHHEEVAKLHQALATSRCIGMAIGILMCRHGLTADDAWERLRQASRNSNREVRDLADYVVQVGELPLHPQF